MIRSAIKQYYKPGFFLSTNIISAQSDELVSRTKQVMLNATRFMAEEVSANGRYLWTFLPDFSRGWSEMEAYETMIWVQHTGTVSMAFLLKTRVVKV